MKTQHSAITTVRVLRTWLLGAALALSSCWIATAEITDSEDSAAYLAERIAASSGGNSSQYMSYSRKLAKTMSQLSPDQQENVLLFDPQTGTGDGGGNEPGEPNRDDYPTWGDFLEAFFAWLRELFGGG